MQPADATLQVVILNLFDVMLAATHVVPRVETTLYTGWSSSKSAAFLQPIILDNIVNFYKGKVSGPQHGSIGLASYGTHRCVRQF